MKNYLLASILLASSSCAVAHDIGTATWGTTIYAGSAASVTSQHHARLINNTNLQQTYWFYASLCVDGMGCTEPVQLHPTVAPHAEITIRKTLYLEKVYHRPGTYQILARTQVVGDGGQTKDMTATVTVK